jgi:hypothetical protein
MRASVTDARDGGGYLLAASHKNLLRACRFSQDATASPAPVQSTLLFEHSLQSFDVGCDGAEYVIVVSDAQSVKYGWTSGGRLGESMQKILCKPGVTGVLSTLHTHIRWIAPAHRFLLFTSTGFTGFTGFNITEEVTVGVPVVIHEPRLTVSSEIGAQNRLALKASDRVQDVYSFKGSLDVLLVVQSE